MCFRPADASTIEHRCPMCNTNNLPEATMCANCYAPMEPMTEADLAAHEAKVAAAGAAPAAPFGAPAAPSFGAPAAPSAPSFGAPSPFGSGGNDEILF